MLISEALLPVWLHVVAAIAMAGALVTAARHAEWQALAAVPVRQHVLFGATLAIFGIWLLSVELTDGLYLHLSLVTALTLVVGWRLAVLAGAIVTAAHTLTFGESWISIPIAWTISVAVPATVTHLLAWALRRTNIRNIFLFLLGAGFGGSALSVLGAALLVIVLFAFAGAGEFVANAARMWAFVLLVMFQEGFLNGLIITALTVFWPGIVKTFDENFYLAGDDSD